MNQVYNNIWTANFPFSAVGDYFRRVLGRKDFFAVVVGKKFSGKSETMGSICAEIDPSFCRQDYVWNMTDFYLRLDEKIEENRPYGLMVLDDFGSEADAYEFLSSAARSINHLIQKSRTFHIGYFLTVPDPKFITKNLRDRLPDYRIEVLGHSAQYGYATIKILKLTSDLRTGKTFYANLYGTLGGVMHTNFSEGDGKLVTYYVPKPEDAFSAWYKPFREELARQQLKTSMESFQKTMDTNAQSKESPIDRAKAYAAKIQEGNLKLYVKKVGPSGAPVWNHTKIQADLGCSSADAYRVTDLLLSSFIPDESAAPSSEKSQ